MKRISLCLAALLMGASTALAVPPTMNYQGQLFLDGSPTTGPVGITFRMFDSQINGTQLWSETDNVTVTGGLFQTTLGDGTAFPATLFSAQVPWLEMEVGGQVLAPRIKFDSVPYALQAARADTASVALSGAGGNELWSTDGTNVWRNSGRIGIGTSNPLDDLDMYGRFRVNATPVSPDRWSILLGDGTGWKGHLVKGDGTKLMTFQDNGQVGIGTTAPATRLEVKTTGDGIATSGTSAIGGFRVHGATPLAGNTVLDMGVGAAGIGDNTWIQATDATDLSQRYSLTLNPLGGNVGIGTTSPDHPLVVRTTTPGQTALFHSLAASGTNYGVDAGAQGIGATTNIGAYLYASGATNNHALIIPSGYGNVGLGTNSPSSTNMLEVRTPYTGTAAFLRSDATTGTNIGIDGEALGVGASTNIGAWFAAGGATNNYAIIVPAGYGNVGIGTDSPAYKLHVVGNVRIEGSLDVSQTKCRVVETDYGELKMNAAESAHALFMDDEPTAHLLNGRCRVNLSPEFLATVTANGKFPLAVNVTFYGRHGGEWYVERDATGFAVIDPSGSNAEFSWQATARQKGYEDTYLEPVSQTAAK